MAETRIVCGTQFSARMALMDTCFIERWGRAMLVLPSRAAAAERRLLLIRRTSRGLWGNPVCDFQDLATGILAAQGIPGRRVDDAERLLLVQACLETCLSTGQDYGIRISPDSPGLARHVLSIINQLKQAAIEPDAFRRQLAEMTAMDSLVAAVYTAYQDALKAAGLYDVPGLYWAAEACCKEQRPQYLLEIGTLLLDGFDDFTPSELRLLERLRPHLDTMWFGVNHDERPGRQDCFQTAQRTVNAIRARFGATPRVCESPKAETLVEFVADHLFWRDPPPSPKGLRCNLAVVACPDTATEALFIARNVKQCLLDGMQPAAIAVAFPDLAQRAPALQSAFDACGIPLRLQYRPSLAQSAPGDFLLRLFQAWRTWSRESVLDALDAEASPWRDSAPEGRAYLSRKAMIISGRREWRYGLDTLRRRLNAPHAQDAEAKGMLERLPGAVAQVDALLDALGALEAGLEELPVQASPAVHASAMETLLDRLLSPQDEEQASAVHALYNTLMAFQRLSPVAPWTRDAFLQRFERALRNTSHQIAGPRDGVLACTPEALRNLRFDRVFLGGLVEGAFPRQPGLNAVYGDADRRRLDRAGIPLEGTRERLDKERLLFHHVLCAAREGLVLTWPLLKEDQRDATPSPFIADVEALLEGMGISSVRSFAEAILPPEREIASLADFRNLLLAGGDRGLNAAVRAFPELAETAAWETRRQSSSPWDARDGNLHAPDILERLEVDFGPDHAFSVRRLETYRECPFRYFQDHVLHIESAETPEAEFDPRVRGIILHDVLEDFHRHFVGRGVPEIDAAAAQSTMQALLAAHFEEKGWRSIAAPPSVRAAERAYMASLLDRYLTIMRDDDIGWKPAYFEVGFGRAGGGDPKPPGTMEPFVLTTEQGPVRFSGRIDRIDLDGNSARIVDYKTGSAPGPGEILTGLSLQCTVYAWALEQHVLPGTACARGVFIPVGRRVGQKPWREALHPEGNRDAGKWAARETTAQVAITSSIAAMRAGFFSPVRGGKRCYGCGTVRACRHDEARVARKQGLPEPDDLPQAL